MNIWVNVRLRTRIDDVLSELGNYVMFIDTTDNAESILGSVIRGCYSGGLDRGTLDSGYMIYSWRIVCTYAKASPG